MPESPEVQELANFLDSHTGGLIIASVDVLLTKALKTASPPIDVLVGSRVTAVTRIAKMLGPPVCESRKFASSSTSGDSGMRP